MSVISRLDEMAQADLRRLETARLASGSFGSEQDAQFKEFSPLPALLPPVPDLDPALLPDSLCGWVIDCGEALQCPLAFVAVPAIAALAGVIGRQLGVAMKQRERWVERSVLWAAIVGRPSSGKSPALAPVQRFLHRLEAERRLQWEEDKKGAKLEETLHAAEIMAAKKHAAKLLASGNKDAARAALDLAEPEPAPPEPRVVVNDATVEKLGELLNQNPRGLVQVRDELSGWLAAMDREGREADRSFWLECWGGRGPYTCDRIGRGSIRVEACAVSIVGGIQPGKLAEYLRVAVRGGLGDDGLMQRFQLAVYPDLPGNWRYQDREFNSDAEGLAWATFHRLGRLDPQLVGAEQVDWCDVPFLRLSEAATAVFAEWQTELMQRLRNGSEPAHMEAHLSKFPATAGRLALVLHLADHPRGPIGEDAMLRALAWLEFLEPHARRLYAGIDSAVSAAHLLLAKRHDLPETFTARDAYRHCWAGLDREATEAGLSLLTEHGYTAEIYTNTGGRPTTAYIWKANP